MKKNYFFIITIILCMTFSELLPSYNIFEMLETSSNERYKIVLNKSVSEKNLLCSSFAKEEVLVDIEGNTFKYFSDVYKEYRVLLNIESLRKSFIFKLYDKIWYRIGFGIVDNNSKCEISSEKELNSLDYGFEYNIGVYISLFPLTVVSDAILLGIDNYMFIQNFDFLKDNLNNNKYKVDADLKVYDLSFNMLFSKIVTKFINLDYGVSISARNFYIVDRYNYYEITGKDYSFLFYLGATFNLSKKEKMNFCISYSLQKEMNLFFSFLLYI